VACSSGPARDGSVSSAAAIALEAAIPTELTSLLRAAPASANPVAETVPEVIIRSSIAQICLLNTEIIGLGCQAANDLAAHPKTALLKTLRRVAKVSIAALEHPDRTAA